jgi:hypothetical protein
LQDLQQRLQYGFGEFVRPAGSFGVWQQSWQPFYRKTLLDLIKGHPRKAEQRGCRGNRRLVLADLA